MSLWLALSVIVVFIPPLLVPSPIGNYGATSMPVGRRLVSINMHTSRCYVFVMLP